MSTAALAAPAAERSLLFLAREVALSAPGDQLSVLRKSALALQPFVKSRALSAGDVIEKIFEIAIAHGLNGPPGSDAEAEIMQIARGATELESEQEVATRIVNARAVASDFPGDRPPPEFVETIIAEPDGREAYGLPVDGEIDHAPATPLPTVCPPAWRDLPLEPMRWLATHRIPAREPTILGGDGGGGKTTVALQLAVAVERGLGDWFGTTCDSGPVIFFSAEEPEAEMRRRLERVARKRGLEPADIENLHFHFADPERCLLGISRPNGPIAPTPLFESLCAAAVEIRPVLVIVDSITATFGGNQNDRVHARTFVSMFRRLARDADCAVLLLDHPSLSGMTNGTGRAGSMDWNNAVRARLHLRPQENEEGGGRELEVMKSNYGPAGEKVKLRWEDGCFVMEAAASAPHQAAAYASADQRYLECLDACIAQGRNVYAMPGKGYAPKAFAEMPQATGTTWQAFRAAQERLFHTCKIENVPFGSPSRGLKKITRKEPAQSSTRGAS